jgi:outer membrane protein assembly factor BamB
LSADGKVHTISPITGIDISGPIDFLPSDLSVSSLNFFANTLYAVTARTCESTRSKVWAVQVQGHEAVTSWPAGAITIGNDGTVYLTIAGDVLQTRSLKLQELYTPLKDKVADATPVFFTWGGHELIAASSQAGGTLLLDAGGMGAKPQHEPIVRSEPLMNDSGAPQLTSLASWESPEGVRWVYAANGRIRAFKVGEKDHAPVLRPTWESKGFYNSATPVIANGVVYTLAGTRSPEQHEVRSTLYALDATTGQRLYSSGETVPADAHSGLAVANGHVCFGGSNETIYCFGLPFEP